MKSRKKTRIKTMNYRQTRSAELLLLSRNVSMRQSNLRWRRLSQLLSAVNQKTSKNKMRKTRWKRKADLRYRALPNQRAAPKVPAESQRSRARRSRNARLSGPVSAPSALKSRQSEKSVRHSELPFVRSTQSVASVKKNDVSRRIKARSKNLIRTTAMNSLRVVDLKMELRKTSRQSKWRARRKVLRRTTPLPHRRPAPKDYHKRRALAHSTNLRAHRRSLPTVRHLKILTITPSWDAGSRRRAQSSSR